MLARLNLMCTDYLRKAKNLIHFVQPEVIELRSWVRRDVFSNVQASKPRTKVFQVRKVGRLRVTCPETKSGFCKSGDANFVLAIQVT